MVYTAATTDDRVKAEVLRMTEFIHAFTGQSEEQEFNTDIKRVHKRFLLTALLKEQTCHILQNNGLMEQLWIGPDYVEDQRCQILQTK